MTFVILKSLHIAFMFMGAALAVGPAVLLYLIARSSDPAAIGRAFPLAERVFQVSTAGYGLGIVFGFTAALVGALDLRASWLVTAYVLVALLAVHGILFDNWTKGVARAFAAAAAVDAGRLDRLRRERRPFYLISAMVVLIVAIVFVMVIKPTLF
jgi:uncharacterized membrane protein